MCSGVAAGGVVGGRAGGAAGGGGAGGMPTPASTGAGGSGKCVMASTAAGRLAGPVAEPSCELVRAMCRVHRACSSVNAVMTSLYRIPLYSKSKRK